MHPETAARLEQLRRAAQPYGAFTPARAAEYGINRTQLRRYVQNGTLVRNVFKRAVYRFDTPAYLESIVDAALLAGAEAVVSHVSALQLHGLTDLIPQSYEFTVPRSRRSRRPPQFLTLHFASTPIPDEDMTTLLGIRVTTAARALIDVAKSTGLFEQIEGGIVETLDRGPHRRRLLRHYEAHAYEFRNPDVACRLSACITVSRVDPLRHPTSLRARTHRSTERTLERKSSKTRPARI
jgi:predicted transcriptional regulator of viral defense system